ncbi:uncharacterized protein LOC119520295 isoform X2 [Choloepus didactylus]|uniref:uncharacterized protein LOC119520295 isoform X2 n=1 Tax=Choloepus didactylus TaxID=27675 RepID=UPI00189CA397|nr:uncharacterized protein LOC119520295 isoform X2 [Choloepus didactylus]
MEPAACKLGPQAAQAERAVPADSRRPRAPPPTPASPPRRPRAQALPAVRGFEPERRVESSEDATPRNHAEWVLLARGSPLSRRRALSHPEHPAWHAPGTTRARREAPGPRRCWWGAGGEGRTAPPAPRVRRVSGGAMHCSLACPVLLGGGDKRLVLGARVGRRVETEARDEETEMEREAESPAAREPGRGGCGVQKES